MPKHKKGIEPDKKIIKLLEDIKTPICDKNHDLLLYFKNKARSNETGIEHAAKSYHGLKPTDIKSIPVNINSPLLFKKDKKFKRVFNYYLPRKNDKKNAIKISILIDKNDCHKAEILTIFITSKIK